MLPEVGRRPMLGGRTRVLRSGMSFEDEIGVLLRKTMEGKKPTIGNRGKVNGAGCNSNTVTVGIDHCSLSPGFEPRKQENRDFGPENFFEHGLPSQRRELAEKLFTNILPLSLQMYACHVIQKAIEVVDLDQKIKMVMDM